MFVGRGSGKTRRGGRARGTIVSLFIMKVNTRQMGNKERERERENEGCEEGKHTRNAGLGKDG